MILLKIYNSIFISYESLHNDKALSGYITEFSSFNVFDKDILDEDEKQSIINNEKEKEKETSIGLNGVDIQLAI